MKQISPKAWWQKEAIKVFILSFFLSLLFVIPFLKKGELVYGDDLVYHLSRIKELSGWLQDGEFGFPGISTRSFYMIGYGVNLFYPWITLMPFALLTQLIADAALAINLGLSFYTFLTAWIAYWCMKKFSCSWLASSSFMIFYVFAIYRTIDGITRFALPEFIALSFLPLLVWSTYEVLFNEVRSWIWVIISFSLIVCTHVLSTFLVCLYLFLFWGGSLYFIQEKGRRTLILLGAGIVALAGSAFFLTPFIEEQLFQSFLQPSPVLLSGDALNNLLIHSFSSDLTQSSLGGIYNIGLPCLVVLLLGGFFFKKMTITYKVIYGISLITFWMTTNLFPWALFQQTPLNIIQFPFRLMMFTTLFTCLTGANLVRLMSEKNSFGKAYLFGVLSLNLFLCVIPWMVAVNDMLEHAYSFTAKTTSIFFEDPDNRYSMWIDQYAPASSQEYIDEIYQHVGYLDGEAYRMPPKTNRQRIQFGMQLENKRTLIDLPIIRYKNTKVWVNEKQVEVTTSKRGTAQFYAEPGPNMIEVGYTVSKLTTWSFYISLLTWVGLGAYSSFKMKN